MGPVIEIIDKEIGNVIEIEQRGPVWKMPVTLGKAYKRLFAYLSAQNTESADAPYVRYVNIDWKQAMRQSKLAGLFEVFTKQWHYYVGVPVSKSLAGEEDLRSSAIAKARYVRMTHRGAYKDVGRTYQQMCAWIQAQGLSAAEASIEFYLNDPKTTKKEDLETIVLIPVR